MSFRLIYTINDDGVHLECTECGGDENLGFDATPEQAAEKAKRHRCDGEVRP